PNRKWPTSSPSSKQNDKPTLIHTQISLRRTTGMKRFVPHSLCFLGFVLLLVAAAKGGGAALPYPDPTAELLDVQRGQLQTAKVIAFGGGIFAIAGIVWIIGRRLRRPSSAS